MVGYELFRDVNSRATAFGKLVESRRHTPSLPVEEVAVNRPFNCGSSSSHFLTSLLPTRHGGTVSPVGAGWGWGEGASAGWRCDRQPYGNLTCRHRRFPTPSR